jgi:hypothetical protein
MAAHGMRDVGEGRENVASAEEKAQLKAQARKLNVLTIVSAVVATAALILAAR